ncbi:MAG TPA: beta-ketoacyl synthase N-terminal-like domain-containing protein, partial [Gemmatimonadota bacterium]|nr:beta-ketoacyl synthase N-terminal-like domain-containing protein [Gemmatimonadota bacterium]
PVLHLSAGSASAGCAIAFAADRVASGAADVAVAGGAECPLHEDILASFVAAGIAAAPCRPFDRRRRGTVLGEGAGAIVLESEPAARRRGARPLAVLVGWGAAGEDGSRVRPDPDGTAVHEACRAALEGRDPASLGWIKAHGTGTLLGDAAEYRGLASLLGRRLDEVPVTSLKSSLGHCLGASGAVETVGSVLALRAGLVPATVGTTRPDPAMPGLAVATRPVERETGAALLLFESFGGRCTALLVDRGSAA